MSTPDTLPKIRLRLKQIAMWQNITLKRYPIGHKSPKLFVRDHFLTHSRILCRCSDRILVLRPRQLVPSGMSTIKLFCLLQTIFLRTPQLKTGQIDPFSTDGFVTYVPSRKISFIALIPGGPALQHLRDGDPLDLRHRRQAERINRSKNGSGKWSVTTTTFLPVVLYDNCY